MPRQNLAMVRRRRDTTFPTTTEIEKLRTAKETEEAITEKLYTTSDMDEDWEPATSSVIKLLVSFRVAGALWGTIGDCDEVYNYWEPLHLFLYGKGFQTWEYSPLYAIRSYLYIYIHYIPASFVAALFGPTSKIAVFVAIRCLIGLFTLMGEFLVFKAVNKRFSICVGRYFVIFSLLSSGMFISSTAFLPSSFAMALSLYSIAFYLQEKWGLAIFATAFSTLVGWPFSAILGLPIVAEMLYSRKQLWKSFFKWAIFSGVVISGALVLCDSYYFGKTVFAPLNIVLYNVLSGPGPELYGVEPLSYYIKNLLLNWNFAVPLAFSSLPLTLCCFYSYFPPQADAPKKLGIPVGKYWHRFTPVFLIWLAAATWCIVFFSQPHKEERFLFPIYPHIALLSALALDALIRLVSRRHEKIGEHLWMILIFFGMFSVSRSYAIYNHYGSHVEVYKSLTDHLMSEDMDFSQFRTPIRVCTGKEWHRFPSSFFIPEKVIDVNGITRGVEMQFLQSEFRGLLPKHFETGKLPDVTRLIPTQMNDKNMEEPSRYVHLDTCDFVIDVDMNPSEKEPYFGSMTKKFETVVQFPYLVAKQSNPLYRAFFVPHVNHMFTTFTNYTLYQRMVSTVRV